MKKEIENTRNIAIIGHGGAGKTSLSDALLFSSGVADRLGKVDEETSLFDFEPEETKRRISINSALHHYEWNKHRVTLIDTPGYASFLTDTRNALRVVEGAVIVLNATSGVEVQTERVWQFAKEYNVVPIIFINKLDRERANFFSSVESIEKSLGLKGVPIQIPVGQEASFKGVVDLLKMKAYIYKKDGSGKFDAVDIPDDVLDEAKSYREKFVENIAESDDILLEKYLEGGELTNDEILEGLRKSVAEGLFVPVLCGSAQMNIGLQSTMEMINLCIPSPLSKDTVEGKNPKTGESTEISLSADDPFSAFIFKTVSDPFAGKLSVFRIYSGSLKSDTAVINTSKDAKERIGQIMLMEGKKQKTVQSASSGDIVTVAKLKESITGDTLCDSSRPVLFPTFPPSQAPLAFAIEPKTKADEDKVYTGLAKILEEDQTLHFERDEQTNEFLLSGAGQEHLEVVVEKLKRKYGVDVTLKTPKVPYKETIRSSIKVQGKYKKQSGGRGQYGDTWLEIEPLSDGKGFEFVDKIVGGAIPRQYIPAVEKGVKEAMAGGVLTGNPVVDIKVTLYDGSFHNVDSSEMAFKIAASMGFKKGVVDARPVLLEPIMLLEINVPDDNVGDIIGDMNSKRGKIQGVEAWGNAQTVKALVPMAEVLNYATDLKSMTGGRGVFSMEFSGYEEVPSHLSQKIIAAAKESKDT